jgi:hypothetical protein
MFVLATCVEAPPEAIHGCLDHPTGGGSIRPKPPPSLTRSGKTKLFGRNEARKKILNCLDYQEVYRHPAFLCRDTKLLV